MGLPGGNGRAHPRTARMLEADIRNGKTNEREIKIRVGVLNGDIRREGKLRSADLIYTRADPATPLAMPNSNPSD